MPTPVQARAKLKPAPLISVRGWLHWNGFIYNPVTQRLELMHLIQ